MYIVIIQVKFQLKQNNSVEMGAKSVWQVKHCGFSPQNIYIKSMTK